LIKIKFYKNKNTQSFRAYIIQIKSKMKSVMIVMGEWEAMNSCLNSFDQFEAEMYNLLKDPEIEKTKVMFPAYLTVQERHKLHRFTRKGEIEPTSYGENDNRYMEIIFSKKYIQSLHDRFYVQPAQNTPEPPVKPTLEEFKKNILVDIMGVIDKHLNNEYINYFN